MVEEVEVDEELELAAVPAEDAAAPGHVSDDEFEEWVRRSQEQTDAALAGWDSSVAFEQRRYGDGGMTMDVEILPDRPEDVGLVEAVIYNEDGTVFEPPPPTPWQELARRIRAGEEIGAEFRQEILGSLNCEDPNCPVCAEHARAIDGIVPELPAWALEVAQRFISDPRQGARVIMSMPRQGGRSALAGQMEQILSGQLADPFAEERARARTVRAARSTLRQMGFAIIERDDFVTLRRSSMVRDTNRYGWFVSELAVMNAMADTQPAPAQLVLPGEDQIRWARREFGVTTPGEGADDYAMTPYGAVRMAPQRQATFRPI